MLKSTINKIQSEMMAFRRQLHRYPELAFNEKQTAKLIVEKLKPYGYKIIENIGKTGIVAILDSGRPGKNIALHANMDALPISETNNFDHVSTRKNLMHACGHDGHTAITLTAGIALAINKEKLNGKIVLLFQPAEEVGLGAKAMINDGILKHEKIDAIFGFHNYPSIKVGQIAIKSGIIMAGIKRFKITVQGNGGHAHLAHRETNPIVILSALIQDLNAIHQQLNMTCLDFVIAFNEFHSGVDENSIPNTAVLHGSLRPANNLIAEKVQQEINKLIATYIEKYRVKLSYETTFSCIPMVNQQQETEIIKDIATRLLGKENIISLDKPYLAYDDFAYFLDKIPGCYFIFGNGEDCPMVHMDNYDFNDVSIPIIANLLCDAVLKITDV